MAKRQKTAFEQSASKSELLWKDRKRYLGLPLSFTRYSVDNDRLYVKKGFFNTETDEVLLYRILDIQSKRSFGQKLCGVGTIVLYNADASDGTLELKNVKKVDKLRSFLSNIIEQRRSEKGITGREMYGVGAANIGGSNQQNGVDRDGDGIPDGPMAPPPPPAPFRDTDGDGIPDSMGA